MKTCDSSCSRFVIIGDDDGRWTQGLARNLLRGKERCLGDKFRDRAPVGWSEAPEDETDIDVDTIETQ